ncbi:MAG: hypothetical protein E6I09_06145 [Chloroflexi bacterium]|nr:MAG: hypothetical protein E6I09_06145 [Chloroflexota bacterium]
MPRLQLSTGRCDHRSESASACCKRQLRHKREARHKNEAEENRHTGAGPILVAGTGLPRRTQRNCRRWHYQQFARAEKLGGWGLIDKRNVDNGGQALVVFVLALTVILGFVAMTVDLGLFYEDRRHLQNTADAAALAGVVELPLNPVAAKQKAQDWAANNGVPASQIKKIEIRTSEVPNDTLYVELEKQFSWVFEQQPYLGRELHRQARLRRQRHRRLVRSSRFGRCRRWQHRIPVKNYRRHGCYEVLLSWPNRPRLPIVRGRRLARQQGRRHRLRHQPTSAQ